MANKIYQDALQQSYINAYMINVVITGAAGSGKTHLLHLLMNDLPPQAYQCTPLWANPIQDLRKLPTTAIRCKMPAENIMDTILSDSIKDIEFRSVTSTSTSLSNSVQPLSKLKMKFRTQKRKAIDAPQELASMPLGTSSPFEVGWIHYLDTGGHPQFRHILPLFVQHIDCNIIVFDMSDHLDGCTVVGCSNENHKHSSSEERSTYGNTIIHCARLLQPVDQFKSTLSKVVVVGTHRDIVGDNVQALDQGLQSLLNPVLNKSLLYSNPGKNKLLYPLNTCSPVEEDSHVANDLCTTILSLTEHINPTSISLRWMLFHQEVKIQATETSAMVMEFETCSKIANCLFMSDGDVIAALEFFADYNIFMYYKSILPHVVFTNPQALSDVISCLLVHLGSSSEDGIISLEMIEHLVGNTSSLFKPGLFSIVDFVNLLLSLRIISRFKNEIPSEKYFMPAILTELKEEQIAKLLSEHQANVEPLLIHFSRPLVPCGTFCRLIVSLLSLDSWQVACLPNSNSPICANSNCIKLLFERHIIVTLCDCISFIEVNSDSDHEAACFRIKTVIIKELNYGMDKPNIAFYCPCQLIEGKQVNCAVSRHTASVTGSTLVCCVDAKQAFPVHAVNIKPWFKECSEFTPQVVDGMFYSFAGLYGVQ